MTSRDKELRDLLVKIDDIKWNEPLTTDDLDLIVKLLKGELDRKSDRQTGPAKGQRYWFAKIDYADFYIYDADDFDLDVCKHIRIYPEERFAEAEIRARKLIVGVNKRRRELNEGKEFGDRRYYILFFSVSGLEAWGHSDLTYAQGIAYPFGLFKDSSDCEMCIHEFKDELKWFYHEYIPLMEELDDYDWSNTPDWGD